MFAEELEKEIIAEQTEEAENIQETSVEYSKAEDSEEEINAGKGENESLAERTEEEAHNK